LKSVDGGKIYVLDFSLLKQYINKYDVIVQYNTSSWWYVKYGQTPRQGFCKFTLTDQNFEVIFNDVTTLNTTQDNNKFYYTNNSFILNQEWFKGAWSNGKYFVGLQHYDLSIYPPEEQINITNTMFMFYLTKKGLIKEIF